MTAGGPRVAIVAEYYPRAADPVLGVWAHRQALAARDAGADVRVLVLHRPLPPLAALKRGDLPALRAALRQPRRVLLDGIEVSYVPYVSPPRPWSYGAWGAWAAPALKRALGDLHERFPFELVHAHYAVPAGDAVRRALPGAPLVVSVHGGDVLATVQRSPYARRAVAHTFAHAKLVLANSAGTAARVRAAGGDEGAIEVVHLGTELPPEPPSRDPAAEPLLVTVGHLVARKRHADVLEALARLAPAHPRLRWTIVGDGPEREPLRAAAARLGVTDRVEFTGQLDPARARARAWSADLFVLPSVDEAFGVAYVEAMAGGVPAIGCAGEDGPDEIAAAGGGLVRVPPRDPAALASAIDRLLRDTSARRELGAQARATVAASFTWEHCGSATVAAYRRALAR
ncbi:glycosyltransferase [Conexibacter woesei]|uniref:Glycosyl transferase group 1 n=1 Tax=Conexibacter woesei (strain DSM 14684 / CCUG 47730 / CIP 108061 / JCM 11494 / NBRC 100937 / ID131577) TaxID=469383 RepID=D3EZS7_CONWI|nr:glycosyltransferase [Conexibacter woesei]ADB53915.1 glycosyl transferase group 1 [Conexibacter woesei DSM 14684]